MNHHGRKTSDAFTLVELLVVLALIAIAIGITVPAMDALQRSGRGAAAANSISTATNAAQIYNHRIRPGDLGAGGEPDFPRSARYSGTAALFTPSGEIRLVVNDQAASDQNANFIEGPDSDAQGFAYRDISGIDYISMPRSVWVVGVRYANDQLELLPPPFAVRFNEYGHVATDKPYIYYDSNSDHLSDESHQKGYYDTDSVRPDNYNPDEWIRTALAPNPITGIRPLPFDRIEVVTGVIAFNTREFYNFQNQVLNGGNNYNDVYARLSQYLPHAYAGGTNQRDVQRLAENSTPINFSPLTGLAIRASGR